MLVLPVEPQGYEAPDRQHRDRDVRDLAEGSGLLDGFEPRARWRACPHHPRESRSNRSVVLEVLTTARQIAHYPTLRAIPAELAPPVLEEVSLYKEALRKCYKSFGAEMVAFEVARTTGKGGHAHVQVSSLVPGVGMSTIHSRPVPTRRSARYQLLSHPRPNPPL